MFSGPTELDGKLWRDKLAWWVDNMIITSNIIFIFSFLYQSYSACAFASADSTKSIVPDEYWSILIYELSVSKVQEATVLLDVVKYLKLH